VDGEVARLGRLVEDLLTLARLDDRGVASIRRERVPVRALCLRVAGRFEADAVALGRALEVRSADRVAIEGDTFRLEQAVGNLVDNALRHGEGRIDLEVRELTEAVEVAVRDEGSGFSPAFAGRAFERFTRGDDSRTGEGTGLGLAIVEAVARAHGGTARIERPVEGGSAVVLRLPR
jgi:two-component system OmpR family sensor kinase